jgi:hypothetical protein
MILRTFTETCYIDSLCPDLMTQFTRLNQASSLFLNRANSMMNSVRASRPTKGTSGLLKASQLLIAEWIDLITTFNSVVGQGLTPHFLLFVDLFTTLTAQMRQVADLLESGTRRSTVSRAFFEQLQADAVGLRREANVAWRMSRAARKRGFDEQAFGRRILTLGKGVEQVFRRAIPRCTMATGEVMRTRTCLNATCNELVRIAEGVRVFEELAAEVRVEMARASQVLDRLLDVLGVPLGIKLEFDEEEDAEADEEEIGLQTKPPLDAMQRHLEDMDHAVTDAQNAGDDG